jgi:hypothetical protein
VVDLAERDVGEAHDRFRCVRDVSPCGGPHSIRWV